MTDLTAFRAETRAWLEANCPPVMRTRMPEEEQVAGGKRAEYVRPEQKIWLDRMAAKGWTAPTWPTQYGGGGLSDDEALILEEEMQDLGCRAPLRGHGAVHARPGAAGIRHGGATTGPLPRNRARRNPLVPGLFRTEARGPTSPACRTRAVLQGEHFLVNGHKIWTSNAHRVGLDLLSRAHRSDGEEA